MFDCFLADLGEVPKMMTKKKKSIAICRESLIWPFWNNLSPPNPPDNTLKNQENEKTETLNLFALFFALLDAVLGHIPQTAFG